MAGLHLGHDDDHDYGENHDDIFDNDDGEEGKDGEDDELIVRLHLLWFEVVWQASWVWSKEGVAEGDLELSVVHVLVLRGEQAV